jgi:hypothetical protein
MLQRKNPKKTEDKDDGDDEWAFVTPSGLKFRKPIDFSIPSIFYAHNMGIYHKPQEQYEIELIQERYPDMQLVNPNGAFEIRTIQDCFPVVRQCKRVVFSTIYSQNTDPRMQWATRFIGKGVFAEVQYALEIGLPVEWLVEDEFVPSSDFVMRHYNMGDWFEQYGAVFMKDEADTRSIQERYGYRHAMPTKLGNNFIL